MFTKTHVIRLLVLIMIMGALELQAQSTQTLKIRANSGLPVLSEPLKNGSEYRITVTGEFSIWSEQLGNGVDAGYIYDVPFARIQNNQWPAEEYVNSNTGEKYAGIRLPAWVGDSTTFPGDTILRQLFPFYEINLKKWIGFRVNGEPLLNSGYRAEDHQYQFTVKGSGVPLTFAIIDSILQPPMEEAIPSYSDNSGQLTVFIEEILPFNVNICSTSPIIDSKTNKMKGIKVDVSVLVSDSNKSKRTKNILFDKNQVAILENGRFICPDTIYCNKTAEAISVALVFDRTKSMLREVSKQRDTTLRINAAVNTAKSFVNTLGKNDQCLLLSFSDETDFEIDVDWTADRASLLKKIDTYPENLKGSSTALHSALISALSKTITMNNKKAIVAITDGGNNSEPLNEEEVIKALPTTGDIPVFIIALGLDTVRRDSIDNKIERENDSLLVLDNIEGLKKMRRIAEASKGKVFNVTESSILDSIYREISKDIREEECCTIEYAVDDCENNLADTVRTVMIYYPFEGGVSAKSATYKTSCAKTFLSKRESGNTPYTKLFVVKNNAYTNTLSVNLKKSDQVSIDLIDNSGKRMKSVYSKRLSKGIHTITINTALMKSGQYTAEVFVKGKKLSQHEIMIKE